MYSEKKANRIIEEFKYLIDSDCYLFGTGGIPHKISKLTPEVLKASRTSAEYHAHLNKDPNYGDKMDEDFRRGNYWDVYVTLERSKEEIRIPLKKLLKLIGVKHGIKYVPN